MNYGPGWELFSTALFYLIVGLYFIPSIVALIRGVNVGSVVVINTFLGWTLLGWVGALALACASRRQYVIVQPVIDRSAPPPSVDQQTQAAAVDNAIDSFHQL